MTHDLINSRVSEALAPARLVVVGLPSRSSMHKELFNKAATHKETFDKVAEDLFFRPKTNPSSRTYYLGTHGRVSQRKQLVGEVLATVRAYTTDHARYQFKLKFYELRKVEGHLPEPFIGKATTCSRCGEACGHNHQVADKVVCHVCANWAYIGKQIVAEEMEA